MRRALLVVGISATVALTGCGPIGGATAGKHSTVVYRVTGSGTAEVRYAATATDRLTARPGVELPWSATVRTRDHSRTVYRVLASGGPGLGCTIEVNGVRVPATVDRTSDGVDCSFVK